MQMMTVTDMFELSRDDGKAMTTCVPWASSGSEVYLKFKQEKQTHMRIRMDTKAGSMSLLYIIPS